MQQVAVVNGFTLKKWGPKSWRRTLKRLFTMLEGAAVVILPLAVRCFRSEHRCGVCGALGHLGLWLSAHFQQICQLVKMYFDMSPQSWETHLSSCGMFVNGILAKYVHRSWCS